MRFRLAIAVTAVFTLACGGLDGAGGGADNQAACKRYVEHMNSLSCYPAEMDADQTCPAALDMSPLDMSEYYDCLVAGATCDGDIPKIETAGCTPPSP